MTWLKTLLVGHSRYRKFSDVSGWRAELFGGLGLIGSFFLVGMWENGPISLAASAFTLGVMLILY